MGVTDSHFTTKLINPGQTQDVPNDFTSSSPDKKALMFIPFNGRFVLFAQGSESYTTQKVENFGFRPLKAATGVYSSRRYPQCFLAGRSKGRRFLTFWTWLGIALLKVELKCTQNTPPTNLFGKNKTDCNYTLFNGTSSFVDFWQNQDIRNRYQFHAVWIHKLER